LKSLGKEGGKMSEAVQIISQSAEKLNTAQLQWETYATGLGLGYATAYRRHKSILNNMKEMRRANAEAMYFILSIVTAGFAGGLVAGVMAPWIKKAAEGIAQAVWRQIVSETAKEFVKTSYKELSKTIAEVSNSNGMFEPAAQDPLEHHLTMTYQVGRCFSFMRDKIEELKKQALNESWPGSKGEEWLNKISEIPLVKDYPREKNMPDQETVAQKSELAMWILWGNVRDVPYWTTRRNEVLDNDFDGLKEIIYLKEFEELNPIAERLKTLDIQAYQLSTVDIPQNTYWGKKRVLDVLRLKNLGTSLGGDVYGGIFKNAGKIIEYADRNKILSNMPLEPIYKR
jgi:hypothetical protein